MGDLQRRIIATLVATNCGLVRCTNGWAARCAMWRSRLRDWLTLAWCRSPAAGPGATLDGSSS